MIWQDLMLDRWVAEPELRHAAALAFGVPVASVAVVGDAAQLVSVPDSVGVLLERTRQHRDFPLQIMVVLRDDDLVCRFSGFAGDGPAADAGPARVTA